MEFGGLKKMQIRMDLICPTDWIDEDYFWGNIKSWEDEIPLNNLYFGCNNKEHTSLASKLRIMDRKYVTISQKHYKTLGACLRDLMERVETEWFCYLHADARITKNAFEVMKPYMLDDVGIIESERVHFDGERWTMCSPPYSTYDRSFSGFQIIRKKAIETILPRIDDDFIYRNEDMIFQSECQKNGYKYVKTWAMHIHQTTNKAWTFSRSETFRMQILGLLKYTEPTKVTIKHLKGTLYPYLMETVNYKECVKELIKHIEKYPRWYFLKEMFRRELNMYD